MSNQFVNAFVRQMGREYAHDIYRSGKDASQIVESVEGYENGKVIEGGPNDGKFTYDGMITRPFLLWVLDIVLLCIPYTSVFYAPYMLYKAIKGALSREVCFYNYGMISQYVQDMRYRFGTKKVGERWGKMPFLKPYDVADNSFHSKMYDKVNGKIIEKLTPTKIAKWFWGIRIGISGLVVLVWAAAFIFAN